MALFDSLHRRWAMGASFIALLLLIAGCGGTGGSGVEKDPPAVAPAKLDFIIKAESQCKHRGALRRAAVRRYIAAHTRNANPYTPAERIGEIDAASLPGIREEVRELESLQPPAGEAQRIHEITAAMWKAIARAQAHPAFVFSPKTDPFKHASELARSYGLFTCAHY